MMEMSLAATDRQLRQFAIACLPGFLLVAWTAHRFGASWTVAAWIAGLGIALGLVGLIRPRMMRWPYGLLMLITAPIGWVVMRFLLLVIFYLVMVPLALVFRVFGRDALRVRSQKPPSWLAPEPPADPPSYYRMS